MPKVLYDEIAEFPVALATPQIKQRIDYLDGTSENDDPEQYTIILEDDYGYRCVR